jgi:hypothetical protein
MSKRKNPIAKDLRTPKYRKQVVESGKTKLSRKYREIEDWIDENAPHKESWQKDE